MRLFRAGIAIWAITEAWRSSEWLLLIPGGIFALQAIFNIGCCGAAGCASPAQKNFDKNDGQTTEDVVYEEVR